MAFETTATVLGAPISYRLHPDAKRYTLRDNGFTETNGGNYQLIRPLDATPQSKEGFKLKITVSKDIQTLKMSITTDPKQKMSQDKFYFLMDGMISRGLFEKVE